jgi:hypothetical protein
MNSPETINMTSSRYSVTLDDNKDYRIVLQQSPVTVGAGGLTITGGHHVVLIGGTIASSGRGLYLKNQTGTVHIERIAITGSLTEGIDLDQRKGATVQLINIRIDQVRGSYTTNHADVVQTWAGPAVLRIDDLTASTTYQGLFLLPHQFFQGPVGSWDFRNVGIAGTAGSGYLLWKEVGAVIRATNVSVYKAGGSTNKMLWPNASEWPGVVVGPEG